MAPKRRRFEVVARFVAERFPRPATTTVLDVAGSTGVLGYHLAEYGYTVTVIDPRRRAVRRRYRKAAQKAGFISRLRYERRPLQDSDCADLLVGLHPDEATEGIVRLAVKLGVGFVVVPCCVMPQDGVRRSFEDWCGYLIGLVPAAYEVHREHLPMDGANLAIWARRPDPEPLADGRSRPSHLAGSSLRLDAVGRQPPPG